MCRKRIAIREVLLGAAVVGWVLMVFIVALIVAMALAHDASSEERGMERAEREFLMWHEECADLREAAMRRYEERRGEVDVPCTDVPCTM